MLRLWNNTLFLLCVIYLASCGFIDLRLIEIIVEPNTMNSILPEPYSPVILKFDTEMDKINTEGILQINSDYGSVRGDKYWRENDLYFVPVSGWTAGIRYTLNLTGTMRSLDGREMRIERFIPFYAINRNDPPLLEIHSPANGASIRTNDFVLELNFSLPMDRLSVESALTIEGTGSKTFEWLSNDKILKVTLDKALTPWIAYRWNLKDSAKSIDGVPIPKTYSGHFTTDFDQALPQITNIYPVLFSNGNWYPTGTNLETGLGQGQAIAVSFSKPMGESALRSLRFEPSLSGRTEFLTENTIIYILSRDPEPDTIYTLTVSGETRDNEGLKIGNDHKINFIPDIPFLNVFSLTFENDILLDDFSAANNVIPVYVDPGSGELSFSIYFSLPFGFEDKLLTPQKITLVPFFPRTLPPVALQYVNWISDDRLYMRWEGLTAGSNNDFFYKLTIPGGRGGVAAGYSMKEDIVIYLEVLIK